MAPSPLGAPTAMCSCPTTPVRTTATSTRASTVPAPRARSSTTCPTRWVCSAAATRASCPCRAPISPAASGTTRSRAPIPPTPTTASRTRESPAWPTRPCSSPSGTTIRPTRTRTARMATGSRTRSSVWTATPPTATAPTRPPGPRRWCAPATRRWWTAPRSPRSSRPSCTTATT